MLNLKVRYVYYITRAHFQTDNYTQVVLVSWHETVEGQDSCKLLKPFNGIKHVKITGYKTLMKIYVDKLCKYSKSIVMYC